jgi:hypothetical protein
MSRAGGVVGSDVGGGVKENVMGELYGPCDPMDAGAQLLEICAQVGGGDFGKAGLDQLKSSFGLTGQPCRTGRLVEVFGGVTWTLSECGCKFPGE